MKREMRRTDRQISEVEINEIIDKCTYGILTVVCEDGYPYGLPINYAYEDGKFYFHKTCEKGLFKENVNGEVKACFTIVGDTEVLPAKFSTNYESVIAFGTVKETQDKIPALMKLVKKLCPDFMVEGQKYADAAVDQVSIYEFSVEEVTGKARKPK